MCNQSQGYYGSNNTLSPAAQAVWEAFNEEEAGVFVDYGEKLAAALRAAVNQVLPENAEPVGDEHDAAQVHEYERATTADAHDEREFPDVAEPDRRTDGCQDEGQPRRPGAVAAPTAGLHFDEDLLQRLHDFAADEGLSDIKALLDTHAVLMSDVQPGAHGELHAAGPDDTCFIQYSSGSTSDPKGVVLTHRNLCVNIRAIVEGFDWGPDDQALSWMPLTHDMGLIGFHLSVMAAGMNHAVMDTNVFVRRPLLWMSKASELRSTQLCSPNFGYKHFLKLYQRKGLPGIDLSCVKRIINGAEPISWDLCEEFFGEPWRWPTVWALNPHITNPHWIYPGNQLRLRKGKASVLKPTSQIAIKAYHKRQPLPSTIQLRQWGFIEEDSMKYKAKITGSREEKIMLAT